MHRDGTTEARPVVRWRPGSHVLTREILDGKIWTARPVTVVRDTPELIALYMMPGTTYKHPRLIGRDVVPAFMGLESWHLVDAVWIGGGALMLSRPGDHYMLMAFWEADQRTLRNWYVNLQEPFRRTNLGFDYLDQELDIVITPDLTAWQWKDEDKFEALVQRGLIERRRAQFLRALGEEVIQTMHHDGSLFNQGWERWTPPHEWRPPELQSGWDAVLSDPPNE